MATKIFYMEGKYCPFIICDVCKDKITDANGVVLYSLNGLYEEQELKEVHAHEGRCSYVAAKAIGIYGFHKLDTHLANLIDNSGYKDDFDKNKLNENQEDLNSIHLNSTLS